MFSGNPGDFISLPVFPDISPSDCGAALFTKIYLLADIRVARSAMKRPPEDAQSGSDEENDRISSGPPLRSVQKSVFAKWMVRQVKSELSNRPKNVVDENEKADGPSISQIMEQQNDTHIVDDPRSYQLELFERAKQENTIAVLDTGTGKTLIAVLLLRHTIDEELERRAQNQSPRIAFFLAPFVNLVFQQHAVLESNLGHPSARIFGGLRPDLWTKAQWMDVFNTNKAVVCTPDVLKICLDQGFLTMAHINLVIFDEAHHAKLDHAYSLIMSEHYEKVEGDQKPRVFGMTASPIDIKADALDIASAARALESTLHSRIATSTHLAPLQNVFKRPTETTVTYPSTDLHSVSPMCQTIQARFGCLQLVRSLLDRSLIISRHLGSWCGDQFWKDALQDLIEAKDDTIFDRKISKGHPNIDSATREKHVALLKELLAYVSSVDLEKPTFEATAVSNKVLAVFKCLKNSFDRPNENRCIVFVEERITAQLLAKLFKRADGLSMKPAALMGVKPADAIKNTLKQQVVTLLKFKRGEFNCIFSTSVAEEGLDIAACNTVIRFDPCKTMIQYVQSRGRARHRNSHLIHMVQMGNTLQMAMLDKIRRAEQLMRAFCANIPDDRKLSDGQGLFDISPDAGDEMYRVEKTGATLTLSNSMRILMQFIATLPDRTEENSPVSFVVKEEAPFFISDAILPPNSPIPGSRGQYKRRKAWSRFSAAFETCMELIRHGFLDEHLQPVYKKHRTLLRQAALALNLRTSSQYLMRTKPDWQQDTGSVNRLYGIIITFETLERQWRDLMVLSRFQDLPCADFPIFLNSGIQSKVQMHKYNAYATVTEDQLDVLTRFTLAVFKDLFNKTYENVPFKMPYWVAPVSLQVPTTDLTSSMDWELMRKSTTEGDLRWSSGVNANDLVGKFLVDPYNGGIRYFSIRIAAEFKPDDPVPFWDASKGKAPTILASSNQMWKRSKSRFQADMSQPVLEAQRASTRRNLLAHAQDIDEGSQCFVCPQLLRVSKIPIDVVTSCYTLPANIHRIESHLIVQEACELLDLHIEPSLALEAMTKDSGATDDDVTENDSINFQHGMGPNYERLEFLGDTFLKMATTIAVYVRNPKDTEHEFHVKRMLQLCNQNLYDVAVERKIYEYIRSRAFDRRTWYPTRILLLAGKGHTQTEEKAVYHALGKKTIADVCEAIIGAAFLTHNQRTTWRPSDWTNAVQAVTKLVQSQQHDMMQWSDYSRAYTVPEWQTKDASASELERVRQVEIQFGYRFNSPRLLHAAFAHPSLPQRFERVPSYQQLEFLGDALIDMVCVTHLMYEFPQKDPHWLTEHKMAMTTNMFLGALCVKLSLHRHLRHASVALGTQISDYSVELEEAQSAAQGKMDYWMHVKPPPKALADIVEAFVGALFLDSGFDYGQVLSFFQRYMLQFFEDMSVYDTYATSHPVIMLDKRLNQDFGCRSHRLMVEEVPSDGVEGEQAIAGLVVHETVIGGDWSQSARYAKGRCASKALEELEGLGVEEFREKFGCDCARQAEA